MVVGPVVIVSSSTFAGQKYYSFSLKRNDFQSNVSKTFSLLRSEEDFFDVSLVSDDQKRDSLPQQPDYGWPLLLYYNPGCVSKVFFPLFVSGYQVRDDMIRSNQFRQRVNTKVLEGK